MARLPNVTREQIKPEDHPYFDETVEIRGRLDDLYGHLLYRPEMAAGINAINEYFPNRSLLSNPLRRVSIMATAREINDQFVFSAHARGARQDGVSEDTIRAIAQGTAPQGLSGDEELVVRYTQEMVRDRKISDATFNAVKDRFGVEWLVDLTGLISYYLMLGYLLQTFEVDLAPGMTPELPL
jgi:4-carboxymuconolactone decarboxylase